MPKPVRPLVLMVEDDQDTRDMYALFMEFSGLRVLTAGNVDAAVHLAVEHQPDVVVTDFLLGGAGTGADLCRRLHEDERTAHIPAVLVTGSARKSDTEDALRAGCAEIRIKPYLPDALLNDIQRIVTGRRGAPMNG